MKICQQCGAAFSRNEGYTEKQWNDIKFCSRQCAGHARRGHAMFRLTPEYFEQRSIPEPNSGCWIWLQAVDREGYGGFRLSGHPYMSAHRGSYIAHRGPVSSDLTIDHLCRLRCCVNPDHLEAVPHIENMRRRSVAQTHCIHGHLLDGQMTKRRYCKQCSRDASAKYLASKKREQESNRYD